LGNNIKLYRRLKDISRPELARRIGVHPLQLSKWETGQALARGSNLILLSDILGVEVWELFYTGKVVLMGNEKLQRIYGVGK
jgi:transcriptional regulator with XRE-family HTH domain